MALAFGWNEGCADARDDCGKRDLLFGRAVDASDESGTVAPLATLVPYGRLLAEPLGNKLGAPFRLRRADAARSRQGAARAPPAPTDSAGSSDDWEKCSGARRRGRRGRRLGTGTCPVERARRRRHDGGAGGGRQRPGRGAQAASRGWTARRRSRELGAAQTRGDALGPRGARAQQDRARRGGSHPERTFLQPSRGNGAGSPASRCSTRARAARWTGSRARPGTPTFPNDGRSLDELARLCAGGALKLAQRSQRVRTASPVQMVCRGVQDRSQRWRAGRRPSAC